MAYVRRRHLPPHSTVHVFTGRLLIQVLCRYACGGRYPGWAYVLQPWHDSPRPLSRATCFRLLALLGSAITATDQAEESLVQRDVRLERMLYVLSIVC